MLSDKQLVQQMVADSGWEIGGVSGCSPATRGRSTSNDIQGRFAQTAGGQGDEFRKLLHDVSARALQLHGSAGTTHESLVRTLVSVVRVWAGQTVRPEGTSSRWRGCCSRNRPPSPELVSVLTHLGCGQRGSQVADNLPVCRGLTSTSCPRRMCGSVDAIASSSDSSVLRRRCA